MRVETNEKLNSEEFSFKNKYFPMISIKIKMFWKISSDSEKFWHSYENFSWQHDEMTKLSSFSKKSSTRMISNPWELYCIKLWFSLLVWHHRQKLKWWSKSCILFTDAFQMLRHCLVPCLLSVHQYKIEEGGLAIYAIYAYLGKRWDSKQCSRLNILIFINFPQILHQWDKDKWQ